MPDDGLSAARRTLPDLAGPDPLSLLRLLLSGRAAEAIAVAGRLDDAGWREFTNLAIDRHRVAPALAAALDRSGCALPMPVSEAIKAEARSNGFAALAQRAESLRLAGLLAKEGITAIWLKGWPLAEQLYGGPGLRQASDIDILVSPAERLPAIDRLMAEGYETVRWQRLRGKLIASPAVVAECKDLELQHRETGLAVELHWRTNHFHGWPDLSDLSEPYVRLPGLPAETQILVPGALGQLIYLASHGQQHLYSRLKWLLDIAKLAEQRGSERLTPELERTEAAGAGRQVRLALHLAWRVFGAPVPDRVHALGRPESDWAAQILSAIADDRSTPGRLRTRFDFYRWHWRMAETGAQRAAVLRSLAWRRLRLGLAGLGLRATG